MPHFRRTANVAKKAVALVKAALPYFAWLRYINPLRLITRLDRYIMGKFIGTYFFAILLIISISIVFDFNENLSKFTEYHAPWKAIVFDYYLKSYLQ